MTREPVAGWWVAWVVLAFLVAGWLIGCDRPEGPPPPWVTVVPGLERVCDGPHLLYGMPSGVTVVPYGCEWQAGKGWVPRGMGCRIVGQTGEILCGDAMGSSTTTTTLPFKWTYDPGFDRKHCRKIADYAKGETWVCRP